MEANYPIVTVAPSREVPLLAGHPWVFSQGVKNAPPLPAGSLVEVRSSNDQFLGIGTYHPANTIRVRILTRIREPIGKDFFKRRFHSLWERKKYHLPPQTDGFRLVHADADQVPGLIVDVYADTAVFQIHTAGIEPFRDSIIQALMELPGIRSIVERSDVEARKAERLPLLPPVVHQGIVKEPVKFRENGMVMLADVIGGQKTGFFLDQREARQVVWETSKGRKVVNLFSYSCAFGVAAWLGGAMEVVNVDSSGIALRLGTETCIANGIDPTKERMYFHQGDVFEYLEKGIGGMVSSSSTQSSLVSRPPLYLICDPPAFAKSRASLEAAKKAYVRLNTLCFQILQAGDLFLTSSCSGMLNQEEFLNLLRLSAGRAGKEARILRVLGQASDHTRTLAFPEGVYLKTVLLEVV
ncbi:MAG: class I SAM-dependent rRNA methyltransferase [Spirochaetes bacterium]|nr:class I SAM-dependent rRNA methyltransferase [Spirochaetota bacterium]